jgi:16S rRNA A1518/A1519 N6-dimethyltransferase RsmA/KsgA/DIM1 with predicted DNA glycosylase/AP lyase activity
VAHFAQQVTLSRQDARTTEQRADCVVSNLPYGIRSHLAGEGIRPVLSNLKRLAPRVTLLTSEDLRDALSAEGYELTQVVTISSARFDRFVHVTRT